MSAQKSVRTLCIFLFWALLSFQWKQLSKFPNKTQLPSPSAQVVTHDLCSLGQKGHWHSPDFKDTVVAPGATNANEFQLLLPYYSPPLHCKYVYLKYKKVFKIHLMGSGMFLKLCLTHFLKAVLGHAETSTCLGSFGKQGINFLCIFVSSSQSSIIKAKFTSFSPLT